MPKYRACYEFDAPDDKTAWLMGQRFARMQPGGRPEFALVNVEGEKTYWGDVSIPDGPGFEAVRLARESVREEIPF